MTCFWWFKKIDVIFDRIMKLNQWPTNTIQHHNIEIHREKFYYLWGIFDQEIYVILNLDGYILINFGFFWMTRQQYKTQIVKWHNFNIAFHFIGYAEVVIYVWGYCKSNHSSRTCKNTNVTYCKFINYSTNIKYQ